MDDDMCRVGAFYEIARPGAFLWRAGASKKRAVGPGSMSRHSRSGHHTLVGGGLLAGFFERVSLYRRIKVCISARGRCATKLRLFVLGFAERFRDVSTNVRHHYAGFNYWRGGGADEVLGGACLRWHLDVPRLFPDRPHGLGNRRLDEWRVESQGKNYCDRFRRRNRRSHELRLVGTRVVRASRAPAGIQKGDYGAA